jgi:hypothetical protein
LLPGIWQNQNIFQKYSICQIVKFLKMFFDLKT